MLSNNCKLFVFKIVEVIIIWSLFYSFESFSHQHQLMVFHKISSDSKSPPVSRTFLSILADLNNVVVWMVSTHVLISNYSSPFTNRLVMVPSTWITIDITVNFMFHKPKNCTQIYGFKYFKQIICIWFICKCYVESYYQTLAINNP